ncbi:bestrophin-like domain [Paraburkholderia saeva]|uniref:DUF4239 domain-containing protein n=1 Tax=Paraburkholderia saeva TaxID=2777537 RepID=A0A9N8X083_9BURK|nr:DUF4239 domain-containing protein [Paraburkholderia saeva]CAG4886885.1 hypothetical protein R70241_00280 [Paraburkholderia saeva]CAG4887104.1 hypothetical protein LMG31841_00338 [Paraburkholderia saeva]
MIWLINAVAHLPDIVILAVGGISTAVTAVGIAVGIRKMIERNAQVQSRSALADVVHASLLAFVVFVMSNVLSDVRANLSKAEDTVLREASIITRVNRDLKLIGSPSAQGARRDLQRYVQNASTRDWKTLSREVPALSVEADADLDKVASDIQAIAFDNPAFASSLSSSMYDLETVRQLRLENAMGTVPQVFWWVISVFLLAAMIMNGRFEMTRRDKVIVAVHSRSCRMT